MGRKGRRGGGSTAKSGGLFGRKAAPAPKKPAGSLFARRNPAPPPSRAPPPPAPAARSAPPPAPAQPQSGGMLSGLGGMVAQGMAIGTGSAIAHQAVNGVVNSFSGGGSKSEPEVQHQQAPPQQSYNYHGQSNGGACSFDQEELYKCLKEQNGDAASCQYYFDALKQCQENQKY